MKQFDQDVAKQIAFKEAEKRTPDHMANLLMLLGCTALSVVMLCIFVAMVLTDRAWLQVPGLVGIFLTIFVFWKVLDSPTMYQTTERIIGRDLDGDGYIGPPPLPETVRLELESLDDGSIRYLHLPESLYQKLPMIAHHLRNGKPFSEGAMTGQGRPLSRGEFHLLRDMLFDRGLATWRDERHPTQGVILTAAGKAMMRQAEQMHTTPPRMRAQGGQKVLPPGSVGG